MIEPPQEKVQFTFSTPSFHYQFYSGDEPEELDPSSCKACLAKFSHPCENEEIDHKFPWRFNLEKSIQSEELYST